MLLPSPFTLKTWVEQLSRRKKLVLVMASQLTGTFEHA